MQAILELPEIKSLAAINRIIDLTAAESTSAVLSEVSWDVYNALLAYRDGQMQDKKRFESTDPSPDLIIEVDVTSPSNIREKTFAAFGVPEIWRFKNDELQILQLDKGEYATSENSALLPSITPDVLLDFLKTRPKVKHSQWLKSVSEWARRHK